MVPEDHTLHAKTTRACLTESRTFPYIDMGPRAPQAHLGVTPSARAARQRSALGRRQHVQVGSKLPPFKRLL